jgi:hypothetical protein
MTPEGKPDRPSNPAELKAEIDSGRTGDKVPGFDPAAAPLGTDAEAAGASPTGAEVRQAGKAEASGPKHKHPNASEPELQPDARMRRSPQMMIGVLAGVVIALLMAAAYWPFLRS